MHNLVAASQTCILLFKTQQAYAKKTTAPNCVYGKWDVAKFALYKHVIAMGHSYDRPKNDIVRQHRDERRCAHKYL